MNKKVKKTLAAGVLATSLLANSANVSAYVPREEIDTTVEDENTVIARTSADWKKLLEKYSSYDCNLDVKPIYDVVEIAEFIRDNYEFETGYSLDTLSQNEIVDEVISYRNPSNPEFSYEEIIIAWNNLNLEDHDAVLAFLNKYAVYLPDLNAHIEYLLITIMSVIRNDLAWYTRQDIENSDFLAEYNFAGREYLNGELAADLSNITFHYADADVNIDLTAPNDEYETVGDGFEDIQSVYFDILNEVTYLGKYMNGVLTPEEEPYFLANDTYETSGKTQDVTYGEQETYEVLSNQEVNDLVREGLRLVETLSPATTYDYEALYAEGVDVTALGYGHWFVNNPSGQMIDSYNDGTKEVINLTETFEKPTLSLTAEEEEVYRLTR